MRIGIDARKIADFGIGTYIRGLLRELARDAGDTYVAFAPQQLAQFIPAGVEHAIVDATRDGVAILVLLRTPKPVWPAIVGRIA